MNSAQGVSADAPLVSAGASGFASARVSPHGGAGLLPGGAGAALGLGWRALQARLAAWLASARQRRRLLRLDDRMLKDIGLSRIDAHQEAGKWFWQA